MLNENLLQFIWQYRLFNQQSLKTLDGQALQIQTPGQWNRDAGPDFLNAHIRIGPALWVGHVELHLRTSDWLRHGHQRDLRYHNLILHVVFEHDLPIQLPTATPILELKDRVAKLLLQRYQTLMQHQAFVPCAAQAREVPAFSWIHWKERLLIERWQQKAALLQQWLEETTYHWEEVLYRLLARNFGLPVNGDAFERLARVTPLQLLGRHKHHLPDLEALLLGQAGLLEENFTEAYPRQLQQQYLFLRKKYMLQPLPAYAWKWARLRPAHFPSLRLAQLAGLVYGTLHLFSQLLETTELGAVRKIFNTAASPYWDTHYRFEHPGAKRKKVLGSSTVDNLLINAVCPLLFLYGQYKEIPLLQERALRWIQELPAERNHVTRQWEGLGVTNARACDSQALLQLKKHYCDHKRCLACEVGKKILEL